MLHRRITRRAFLRTSAAGALGACGTFGYTWRIEPHWVDVVERTLPIAHLPGNLAGKRLVQISDLHIGPIVDDDFLIRAMRRINDLQPDLLAITGDFMTCNAGEQVDHAISILSRLSRPTLQSVAVLGNHDYGRQWQHLSAANDLAAKLGRLGFAVLRNESITIDGLAIAGVDDLWGPNFNPEPMLAQLAADRANLVLCHNPDAADKPVWSGYRGWMLSGHTHGGQCSAPFFGPPILPVRNKRYVEGEIDLHDGRTMYINRGLGYLRRVRFNARPEITVFTLQPS